MALQKVYLDTSVFIAEFDKMSTDYKLLTDFLKKMEKVKGVEFCYSKWAMTEMYNKLTKDKIKELKIVKYIKELLDVGKLRSFKLRILNVSPKRDYDFNEFFRDLASDLIKYKRGKGPGVGDVIHIRIMKNNKIKSILTFDSDFENIPGFTTINLRKIKAEETNGMNNEQK